MALTGDRNTFSRRQFFQGSFKLAATTSIFAGAMTGVNAAGYLVPASNTAGIRVLGRANEQMLNPGAAGAQRCEVDAGIFKWANSAGSPVVQASVGDIVYVEDDQTVALAASNSIPAGICLEVETDGVWVLTFPGATA